ncbi:MAG: hypothetical protein ACXVEF_34140 [Polyangiales bacterium]
MRALALFSLSMMVACSSNSATTAPAADAGPGGGVVSGAADSHCMGKKQPTDPSACHPVDGGTTDTGHEDASTDSGEGGTESSDFGPTMYGSEGDDDDCKYHVKWSITPTHLNEDETVSVTITRTVDGMPATGADPNLEIFLDETHPAPSSGTTTEGGGGSYTISGVRFDASGRWTVRFHVYETCVDGETSPDGHVAFFVSVP